MYIPKTGSFPDVVDCTCEPRFFFRIFRNKNNIYDKKKEVDTDFAVVNELLLKKIEIRRNLKSHWIYVHTKNWLIS
jgi:hypothetical protein